MAAEERLRWCLVYEEILSNLSTVEAFFNAVEIWIERPQVLNRRLVGSYVLQSFLTTKCDDLFSSVLANRGEILKENLLGLAGKYERGSKEDDENVVEVKIRSLLPRESSKYCNVLEMIIKDENNKSVSFLPFEEDQSTHKLHQNIEHAYQVYFLDKQNNSQSISLSVAEKRTKGNGITCPTVAWLKSFLVPKLHKWTIEDGGNSKFSLGQSLRLVSVEKYSKKYEELKKKYKHFVEMWPERTDPHKFVYEDVAIATYLLLLWEDEKETNFKPQTFVDLGCGNGLLVHILTNEGHLGKGVDLRSRKVWKFYDSKTVLEVTSLDPSSQTYPDVGWLIGNHSDELTPWIPVIAARSSYNCKYFVLPCCFHDFYCKFQRASSNERQYRSYLDYVKNVGETCGFDVKEDVLRIPSTKKVCQIGQNRTNSPETQTLVEEVISKMLENARYGKQNEASLNDNHPTECQMEQVSSSCHHNNTQSDQSQASRQFVPRCDTEPVKNCTKLDKHLLDEIVQKVATELLSRQDLERNLDCVETEDGSKMKAWNKGGFMKLSEVSELFDQNVLRQLRFEAGGIKTVLRNSHQIFKVQGGMVEIRDWREDSHCTKQDNKTSKKQSGTQKYWKTKLCWFYDNHPDGCPLGDGQCSFAHGANDLRTLP